MLPDLILASTSPYRRGLLERLTIEFRCIAPGIDEDAAKREIREPVVLAERLAEAKANAVALMHPDAVVIGSDQVATIDGKVLGKPGTPKAAIEQLERLSGRTHELITAVCIIQCADGIRRTHTDRTRLTMRSLSHAERERYVAIEKPIDCAGSYKIESAGIALFDRIETADFTAITGLPLMAVTQMLREFGIGVP